MLVSGDRAQVHFNGAYNEVQGNQNNTYNVVIPERK